MAELSIGLQDIEFLNTPRLRAARIELDFLEPEFPWLPRHRNTVVVFGSTRIVEPAEAPRRLKEAQRQFAQQPGNALYQRAVAEAERILAKSCYYDVPASSPGWYSATATPKARPA